MSDEARYLDGSRIPGTMYEVRRLIARGSSSDIYEVQTTADHIFAMKVQSMPVEEETGDRLRGLPEHPNLVKPRSLGVTSEMHPRPIFLMDRLVGRSMRTIPCIRPAGQPWGWAAFNAVRDVTPVCAALVSLHDARQVHGALSGRKVFAHFDGDRIVMKLFVSLSSRPCDEDSQYWSPEIVCDGKPDVRSDVFAFGAFLFHLLDGRPPFLGEASGRHERLVQLRRPRSFALGLGLPQPLPKLIDACLEYEPKNRPPTMWNVLNELQSIDWRRFVPNEPDDTGPLPAADGGSSR